MTDKKENGGKSKQSGEGRKNMKSLWRKMAKEAMWIISLKGTQKNDSSGIQKVHNTTEKNKCTKKAKKKGKKKDKIWI